MKGNMMKKILILVILNINILFCANEHLYTDAKLVIQMIEKSDIVFIAAEKMDTLIRGSRMIDTSALFSASILGKMPCSPLYSCPSEVEKQLSELGIKRDDFLVIYDKSYGVYASTLYTLLKSLGHKKMTILDGGVEAILKIDPNQKLYNKYMDEINKIAPKEQSLIKKIQKKLDILKPHLLVQKKSLISKRVIEEKRYQVDKGDISFLLSADDLKEMVKKIKMGDKNITIIDSCPMVDIVGNKYGSYEAGVTPISWKKIIKIKENRLKSKEELSGVFSSLKKEKEYVLYCMEDSKKALFMMTVMCQQGFNKVKAFTGNWSVWKNKSDIPPIAIN